MKLKEKWGSFSFWQKAGIVIRDAALFAVLLSAPFHILADYDNTILVGVCLPLSAVAQCCLNWKQDKKMALFFLCGAVFVLALYCISAVA